VFVFAELGNSAAFPGCTSTHRDHQRADDAFASMMGGSSPPADKRRRPENWSSSSASGASGWGAAAGTPSGAAAARHGGIGAWGAAPHQSHRQGRNDQAPMYSGAEQQEPTNATLAARLFGQVCGGRGVEDPIRATVADLPIVAHKESILSLIESNQVVIVTGETGSGKTTQV
jgi:hypothetical protein